MDELRVYYDDNGNILCYTCEQLEGNYLVIDNETYASANPNYKVIDGKLVKKESKIVVRKLTPSTTGVKTLKDNVCIVVPDNYKGKTISWEMTEYEYKPN